MTNDETIEAMAQAIYECDPDTWARVVPDVTGSHLVDYSETWENACDETKERCLKQAAAALSAIQGVISVTVRGDGVIE